MKLVTAHGLARRQPGSLGDRHRLAIAKRQASGDLPAHRQHATHLMTVELTRQIQQTATLGQYRMSAGRESGDLGAESPVRFQLSSENLRKSTGEHQRSCPGG